MLQCISSFFYRFLTSFYWCRYLQVLGIFGSVSLTNSCQDLERQDTQQKATDIGHSHDIIHLLAHISNDYFFLHGGKLSAKHLQQQFFDLRTRIVWNWLFIASRLRLLYDVSTDKKRSCPSDRTLLLCLFSKLYTLNIYFTKMKKKKRINKTLIHLSVNWEYE